MRLRRVVALLEAAGCRYAVIGGNAVAAWVATVDESAVRNTQDVDLLLDRAEFPRVREVLESGGFIYRHAASLDLFLEGPGAKARDAVHIVFAGEKVRPDDPLPAPSTSEALPFGQEMRVISLDSLVRMKLTSFRRKDQVHILDLIGVGLVGEKTIEGLPEPLASRLRDLIEEPES